MTSVVGNKTAEEIVNGHICGICEGELIRVRPEPDVDAVACPVHGYRWRSDHGWVRGRQSDAFHRASADR